MKTNRAYIVMICLITTAFLLSSCEICPAQPSMPTYIRGIYSRPFGDPNATSYSSYDYLKFYPAGIFTYVNVEAHQTGLTASEVYNQIAIEWLQANNVPGHTGNYVIIGDKIYMNYASHEATSEMSLSGTYTASGITIHGSNNETWVYTLLTP
jgi:hypothetical protein